MRIRYLGFALLTWFPGVLHAQSAAQPCSAPSLRGGFFAPKQETYSPETKLTYTCDNGRKPTVKGWWATSTCQNGKWSHEPQCIGSIQACGEPPKIPHAVIIHQEYQEVFAVDSEVQYECEDGYTVEEADGNKSIFCIAGSWTEGPTCRTGPGTGHSGSTVGGTDGTQPGGGSSTTSGFNDRDSRPLPTTIDHCGAHPNVPNGIVVQVERKFLKYQCNAFYTQVGSDTVTCSSNGKWSQLPICKEAFCVLDLAVYKSSGFKLSGVEYVKEGETKQLQCIWVDWWRIFRCTNGRLTYTQCCHANDIYYGRCR
ncbi:complement factor H-like isoform X4 [Siniperca chuatsi]|uniref:complement factor H-like isoform X4 n=1 Tax=Siniperca chuatsi TaxID=119488 RepID=UPI001CE17A85|nr:complement factor H-like isoform X4 [Siniperca chuatsi]